MKNPRNHCIIMVTRKKTVLVSGGGGFIGANLVRKLLKENYEVHLLFRKTTNPWRIREIQKSLTLHTTSLLNPRDLKKLLQRIKPSIIFHLATYGSNSYQNDLRKMYRVNLQGTLNLLLATQEVPYEMFINTGTSSEYGFKEKPMKESDVLKPESFYAATKASATLLASVFAKTCRLPVVTIRPFSVYGPYENPRRFIPTIVRRLIEGKPIPLTPKEQRRDFVFVDDVVDAYLKVAKKKAALSGRVLNIGSGKQYTNDEVVETLFRVTKKRVPVKKGAYPKRLWDTSFWVADLSETKRLLGWKPKYSLEDGLLKTYAWYKTYE